MSLLRSRYFAVFLLLLVLSIGAWKLASPTTQQRSPSAQVAAAEKQPGLAAPAEQPSYQQPASAPAAPARLQPAPEAPAALSTPVPPSGPKVYKVAIQVGHYKISELPEPLARLRGDVGTSGGGRSEVSLNFDIANRVAALLRAQGIVVDLLPATVPSGYRADAFIAIHADGNASPTPRGFKISTRWRSNVAWQDTRLVEMLSDAYGAATGLPQDSNVTRNMRGYYAYASWRPNYRISNFTPAAIVEMGYMTNAADRAVLFNAPGNVATGIATGVVNFLKEAYSAPGASRSYGAAVVDHSINMNAPWGPPGNLPPQGQQSSAQARPQTGNWLVLVLDTSPLKGYSDPGGGQVVARLQSDHFYHSTLRKGDYYRIDLPDGTQAWVNRMFIVVQM